MKPQQTKTLTLWIVVFLMMALVAKVATQQDKRSKSITYPEFIKAVEEKRVETVVFKGKDQIIGNYIQGYDNGATFKLTGNTGSETFKILRENNITPEYAEEEKQTFFASLLINWGPMILLIVIFYFFLRQIQAGGGKAMSFGKSKAKMLSAHEKKVTFSDVSGVEEAKEELVEVVDFLKDPKKYTALGGKIPKGVILVGPPGTGKTLLARAVAGEADVPFFSISGSDFVEMFVGVGASRVRDLFEQGKKHAPCIIFIDEIDAVGRHRGAGMGGGHDEREQTLNQLLDEMDGFESNEGVILIAATNRIDVLDPALLRPGRFDRRVTVGPPDVRGRLGILTVHTKKTPTAENVDLETIAKGTPGFTGADLANLVNEAALNAARYNKKTVEMDDFETAKDKVLMGPERKSLVISDKEKRLTAFHEAGHTLVGHFLPEADPIHKVSIMPRGGALGITMQLPAEDRLSMTTNYALNRIAILMGGRVAEEIVFDDVTSGASNDIQVATSMAHKMVCECGMSRLGPLKFHRSSQTAFSNPGNEGMNYSEETAEAIDSEVKRIIDENYEVAKKILTEHRETLDRLSEALIVWETLDKQQVIDVVEGRDIGKPSLSEENGGGTPKPEAKEEKVTKKEEPSGSDPSDDPVLA